MVVLWQHKRSMAMDGRWDVDGKMNITDVYCLLITLTCTPKAELRRVQFNRIRRMPNGHEWSRSTAAKPDVFDLGKDQTTSPRTLCPTDWYNQVLNRPNDLSPNATDNKEMLGIRYYIYSNKRRGAYLIFAPQEWRLFEGGTYLNIVPGKLTFCYIFIQWHTFYLLIFLSTSTKLIVNLELREKFTRWKNPRVSW